MTEIKEVEGRFYRRISGRWRLAEERTCAYCGNKFYYVLRKPNKRHGIGRYCSGQCASFSRNRIPGRKAVIRCVICKRTKLVRWGWRDRYSTCGRKVCLSLLRRRIAKRRWNNDGGF